MPGQEVQPPPAQPDPRGACRAVVHRLAPPRPGRGARRLPALRRPRRRLDEGRPQARGLTGGAMSEDDASPAKVAASVAGGAAAAVAGTKLVQKVLGQAGKRSAPTPSNSTARPRR